MSVTRVLPPSFGSEKALFDNNEEHFIATPSMYADPACLLKKHAIGGFIATAIGTAMVALVILTALTLASTISPDLFTRILVLAFNARAAGIAVLFTTMITTSMLGLYIIYKGASAMKEAWYYDRLASHIRVAVLSANGVIAQLNHTPLPRDFAEDRDAYIRKTFEKNSLTIAQATDFLKNLLPRNEEIAKNEEMRREKLRNPSRCF